MALFASCSDDDKEPEVPTAEQIVGEYSADKLKVEVDGKVVADAKIDVISSTDNSLSAKLYNIISGVGEYTMPVTFEALSRSTYTSTLKGAVVDNVIGYEVNLEGAIDDKVLTATVTTKEIVGEPVAPEQFIGVRFKGNMNISVAGGGEPVAVEQTVYITKTATEDLNTFCLNINNFSFEGLSLGNIKLDSVAVVKRGDVYGFSAEGCKLELDGDLPMEVTLDVKGAIVDNNMMTMNLTIDASGLKVNVAFEGKEFFGFNMNEWNTVSGKLMRPFSYQEPVYMATSNYAAVFFQLTGMSSEPYFVSYDETEKAAKVITRDTEGKWAFVAAVPKSTAGTLFVGRFELNASETLKSTKFGTPYNQKPVTLKFTYKYTPGAEMYKTIVDKDASAAKDKVKVEKLDDAVDGCSVSAYLYEVESYDDFLDGTNINSSDSPVILKAVWTSGKQDSFIDKEIKFEETGKGSYDPAKKYKLALVCTSSKDGDQYVGAPESTLWIKNLEIVGE